MNAIPFDAARDQLLPDRPRFLFRIEYPDHRMFHCTTPSQRL
jgi:hypothetical protein